MLSARAVTNDNKIHLLNVFHDCDAMAVPEDLQFRSDVTAPSYVFRWPENK
jgi:hypothetical protein